jgi:hypothetical protein
MQLLKTKLKIKKMKKLLLLLSATIGLLSENGYVITGCMAICAVLIYLETKKTGEDAK